jgi:hypothetical protein
MNERQIPPATPASPRSQDEANAAPPQITCQAPIVTVSQDTCAACPGPRYGRFALQRFHAKGGLGEVHVATDEELRRGVALKRMQELPYASQVVQLGSNLLQQKKWTDAEPVCPICGYLLASARILLFTDFGKSTKTNRSLWNR